MGDSHDGIGEVLDVDCGWVKLWVLAADEVVDDVAAGLWGGEGAQELPHVQASNQDLHGLLSKKELARLLEVRKDHPAAFVSDDENVLLYQVPSMLGRRLIDQVVVEVVFG